VRLVILIVGSDLSEVYYRKGVASEDEFDCWPLTPRTVSRVVPD